MLDFHGKSVVVTGGSRGMGEAIVRKFVANGARVIVGDVLDEQGEALAAELGESVTFLHLDVSQEESWNNVRGLIESDHGGEITALVNCAGIIMSKSIEDTSLAEFRRVLDVNLVGTWLGMHTMASSLRAAKDSVIINFSSTQGIYAKQNLSAYVATKWAVRGMTKTAALEFARSGIRVCSVHPGPIDTAMAAVFDPDALAALPIPRLGHVDEVAATVWFIASEATYSTGSEFIVDGGILLGGLPPAE